jgi:hypothetical protein
MPIRRATSTITKEQVTRLNIVEIYGLPKDKTPFDDLLVAGWVDEWGKVTPLGIQARKEYYHDRLGHESD